MLNLNITPDDEPVTLYFDTQTQNELIKNTEYFEYTGGFLKLGPTYDIASFFENKQGDRYCVIHSIISVDHKTEFENKIRSSKWQVSACVSTYKLECIKDYIKRHNCNQDIVYCIMPVTNM